MIYKLDEYIYVKKDKYTFKSELYLNNNNRLVYCFVVTKGRNTECLLQSLTNGFTKDEKDKAINEYLSFKKVSESIYSELRKNAKELVKLVSYKRVK